MTHDVFLLSKKPWLSQWLREAENIGCIAILFFIHVICTLWYEAIYRNTLEEARVTFVEDDPPIVRLEALGKGNTEKGICCWNYLLHDKVKRKTTPSKFSFLLAFICTVQVWILLSILLRHKCDYLHAISMFFKSMSHRIHCWK